MSGAAFGSGLKVKLAFDFSCMMAYIRTNVSWGLISL